jgi:hypothetical protein
MAELIVARIANTKQPHGIFLGCVLAPAGYYIGVRTDAGNRLSSGRWCVRNHDRGTSVRVS